VLGFFLFSKGTILDHGIELIGGKQQLQFSSWHGSGKSQLLDWFASSLVSLDPPVLEVEGAAASFSGPQHSTLLNSGMFE